jgi:hypothetical protein
MKGHETNVMLQLAIWGEYHIPKMPRNLALGIDPMPLEAMSIPSTQKPSSFPTIRWLIGFVGDKPFIRRHSIHNLKKQTEASTSAGEVELENSPQIVL